MSSHRKGIAVRHSIDVGPHALHLLNNVRLTQVLMNLLSNAISYTDQGTVQLNVTWEHYDKLSDRDTINFRVIDTGKGIVKAVQADIFKKFRTLSVAAGTGELVIRSFSQPHIVTQHDLILSANLSYARQSMHTPVIALMSTYTPFCLFA